MSNKQKLKLSGNYCRKILITRSLDNWKAAMELLSVRTQRRSFVDMNSMNSVVCMTLRPMKPSLIPAMAIQIQARMMSVPT